MEQTYLNNISNRLNTTYQRLSFGLHLNSAKDDAAGLNISDRLTSQINGINQGNRNANDAIALAQTMEGSFDEITNMLQHMRALAVQAANGINTADDKGAIMNETIQLSQEISRIATQTTHGGKQILNGADTKTAGDKTIFKNTGAKGSSGTISFPIGSNSGDIIDLNINSFQFSQIISRVTATNSVEDMPGLTDVTYGGIANGVFRFVLSDTDGANNALSTIDKILSDTDAQRSTLGSIQNRLESAIRVQSNVATNEADARSRIRDTDFAEESANLSQQSIIQQAATSMLMQANSRPQIGLSLLG